MRIKSAGYLPFVALNVGSSKLKSLLPILIGTRNGLSLISSWSGEYLCDDVCMLSIDRKIAKVFDLHDGDQVQISIFSEQIQPADSVTISPVETSDWDILELNSKVLESKLLDQISVIKAGLVFPFYISLSGVIFLKVVSTSPSMHVYLQEFTEVHVIPNQQSNIPLSQSQPMKKERSPTALANVTQLNKSRNHGFSIKDKMPSKLVDSLSDVFCAGSGARRHNGLIETSNSPEKHFSTEISLQSIPNVSTVIKFIKAGSSVSSKNGVHGDQNVPSDSKGLRKFADDGSAGTSGLQSHTEKNKPNSDLILPPYQGILCKSILSDSMTCLATSAWFCAEITPINKINETKKSNSSNQDPEEIVKIVIQVKLLPAPIWKHLNENERVLLVNPLLLEQLQVGSGTKIQLNCFHGDVKRPKGMVLHCKPSQHKEMIKTQFSKYLNHCVSLSPNVIINQGTLFTLNIEGASMNVVGELIGVENDVCGRIDSDGLESFFLAIEDDEEVEDDLSNAMEKAVNYNNVQEIVDDLTTKFLTNNRLRRCQNFFTAPYVVLVHGKSIATSVGCGKTLFSETIANHFRSAPLFYSIEIVRCVELRGKKIETIRDLWHDASERLCEPGILIIDDLDELIINVDPLQDGHVISLYVERLVDMFQSFFEMLVNENRNLHVIVTSTSKETLHRFVMPESNCHIFSKYVCLTDMSKDNLEILKNNLKSSNSLCDEERGGRSIAAELRKQLEGCTMKDIHLIIRKTLNEKLMISQDEKDVHLSCEDIQKTLNSFKSPLLHGVDLHKPKKISWIDIGGLDSVKGLLKETLIWPALYPELLSKSPLRLTSGVLLYGVPGTAKTMLASAVAYESRLNFISIKGPELLSKYVGSSETNVRDLFARAQAAKPCIVFFDELDSFAPRRGHDNTGVTDRVVNQLLTQLDGVESLDGVFVLAATSRPDLIDPALLRPGRFDKSILCGMPNKKDRLDILHILTKELKLQEDVDLNFLASVTEDFSGADLKALLYNAQVESAHSVLRLHGDKETSSNDQIGLLICMEDFKKALDVTQASVTIEERKKFEMIFRDFGSGREKKSVGRDFQTQRVTLA
ncbi:peroxisomal ATPase PEX1-like isoform X2 [Hydractinia symbiolongicarpus]|uniref:peroxisomal ATPase PEX1-like isoform X2 n=1 Tax=Hydractinia symbiolongicarpus TaxID=13093 RepID=UPI002551B7F5|nr:peroxisomal ATPase PEX1-like isoform X2 [Hydractinia symbiolongicarpus]